MRNVMGDLVRGLLVLLGTLLWRWQMRNAKKAEEKERRDNRRSRKIVVDAETKERLLNLAARRNRVRAESEKARAWERHVDTV